MFFKLYLLIEREQWKPLWLQEQNDVGKAGTRTSKFLQKCSAEAFDVYVACVPSLCVYIKHLH